MENQETKNKRSWVTNIITVIVTIVAGAALFATGYLVGKFQTEPANGKVWNSQEITIGFTNTDGFMIYNHNTEKLEMYDSSLGQFLFLSYANKLHKEEVIKK